MTERIQCAGLGVDSRLHTLVSKISCPGPGSIADLLAGAGPAVIKFMGRNEELTIRRPCRPKLMAGTGSMLAMLSMQPPIRAT